MLVVAGPEADAGGLLCRVGERVTHLALVEPQHCGRSHSGDKGRGEHRWAAPPWALADAERGDYARADVVAERHGAHEVAAASIGELGRGQCRRYGAAAEMNRTDRIGVVGLV